MMFDMQQLAANYIYTVTVYGASCVVDVLVAIGAVCDESRFVIVCKHLHV